MLLTFLTFCDIVLIMSYSIINDENVLTEALKLCKGSYQQALLRGSEALSGATLTGRAKEYIGIYRQSGLNLLKRCKFRGLPIYEIVGAHNKRIIVIGDIQCKKLSLKQ